MRAAIYRFFKNITPMRLICLVVVSLGINHASAEPLRDLRQLISSDPANHRETGISELGNNSVPALQGQPTKEVCDNNDLLYHRQRVFQPRLSGIVQANKQKIALIIFENGIVHALSTDESVDKWALTSIENGFVVLRYCNTTYQLGFNFLNLLAGKDVLTANDHGMAEDPERSSDINSSGRFMKTSVGPLIASP